MTLHEAIKQVIACDGMNAVTDVRIINILSDFQAFTDCPSAKYVLRAMISDGYIKRLLTIGAWNVQAQQLLNRFVSDTGFQPQVADIVLQSVAYGLGWKKCVEVTVSTNSNGNNPSSQSVPSPAKPGARASLELWEDYLESLVEWKVDLMQKYNVKANLSIRICEDKKFFLYCDLEGNTKNAIALNAAIYDEKNRMKTHVLFLYTYRPLDGYYSADCLVNDIKANNVGKIIISERT
ncbi:MAG: hypothetical protein KHX42_07075 [Prevotella sp.]|nr:hypothetical protein [Prevotella sp.]